MCEEYIRACEKEAGVAEFEIQTYRETSLRTEGISLRFEVVLEHEEAEAALLVVSVRLVEHRLEPGKGGRRGGGEVRDLRFGDSRGGASRLNVVITNDLSDDLTRKATGETDVDEVSLCSRCFTEVAFIQRRILLTSFCGPIRRAEGGGKLAGARLQNSRGEQVLRRLAEVEVVGRTGNHQHTGEQHLREHRNRVAKREAKRSEDFAELSLFINRLYD